MAVLIIATSPLANLEACQGPGGPEGMTPWAGSGPQTGH